MSDDTEHNHDNAEAYQFHDFNDDLPPNNDGTVYQYDLDKYANQLNNTPRIDHNNHTGCYDNGAKCYDDFHVIRDDFDPTRAYVIHNRPVHVHEPWDFSSHRPFYSINRAPGYYGHSFGSALNTDPAPQDRDEHGRSAGNWIRILVDRLGFIRNFQKNH